MSKYICTFCRWLFRLEPRCYICQERDSDSKGSIPQYGIYGEVHNPHFFHNHCIEEVLEDPELYGHAMVDRALLISDKIVEMQRDEQDKREAQAIRIARLKDNDDFWGAAAVQSLLS